MKEVKRLKKHGFAPVGEIKEKQFSNAFDLVTYLELEMNRDVYPGMTASQSLAKWLAEDKRPLR